MSVLRQNWALWILVVLWLCSASAKAVSGPWVEHDQVRTRLIAGDIKDGSHIETALHIELKPGWKTYWRSPGDAGQAVTLKKKGESIEVLFPAPTRYVEEWSLETFGYANTVTLPLKLYAQPGERLTLNAHYMVCAELCIPYQDTLSIQIPETYQPDPVLAQYIKDAHQRIPTLETSSQVTFSPLTYGEAPNTLSLTAQHTKGAFTNPDLFTEGPAYFRFPKPQVTIEDNGRTAHITLPYENTVNTDPLTGTLRLTLVDGKDAVETFRELLPLQGGGQRGLGNESEFSRSLSSVALAKGDEWGASTPSHTISPILFFAFLGGLILNVMPCVLPVLSLKFLSVITHSESPLTRVRLGFLISAAGILTSFLILAVGVITLKVAGMQVGWGFHFQQPAFLITLSIIITLFAANLFGLFEIRLPAWLGGRIPAGPRDDEHSLTGHFMTGVFATLLATPCSAPFLGTAISFALSRGSFEIVLIHLFIGLGLAFPYLLVAAFPNTARHFPKPGAWMLTVKKIMGILLLATVVWLLWIVSHQLTDAPSSSQAAKEHADTAINWQPFDPESIPSHVNAGKNRIPRHHCRLVPNLPGKQAICTGNRRNTGSFKQ